MLRLAPALRRTVALLGVLLVAVTILTGLLLPGVARAGEGDAAVGTRVEILPLRGGLIDPPVAAQVHDVIELAERDGSQLVVLQYSAGGGVSVDLDELLTMIDETPVPVAVLVGPLGTAPEAVGAAGLLWLAADIRAVTADAHVGPLDPSDLAALDERSTTRGHAERLVAAAGGEAAVVDELLDRSLDAEELAAAGLVNVPAQGLEPLLVELDGRTIGERTLSVQPADVEVRFHSLGLLRRVLHAATTGPFIYLLLTVGLAMLLFELFQPGFGVAGFAGVIAVAIGAFGLVVLPVTWWAVGLVVLGLILYALDTAIAGFGAVTVAATVAFAAGSANLYAADALALPWWLIAGTTLTALVFFVFVMTTVLRAQAGPEGVEVGALVGRSGVVRSVLNPEGHVYIDGALWRARWIGESKRAKVGTPVTVRGVDGAVVEVDAVDAAATTPGGDPAGRSEPQGRSL